MANIRLLYFDILHRIRDSVMYWSLYTLQPGGNWTG